MFLRARLGASFWRLVPLTLAASAVGGCGSRTDLFGQEVSVDLDRSEDPTNECEQDEDCPSDDLCAPEGCVEGSCQVLFEVECSVADACLVSACDPATGACVVSDATDDLDGDGFRGPLPGTVAGQPGSCGDDCDDTSPLAFPGGVEVCDGVDNDCDGVIDNEERYLAEVTPESGVVSLARDDLEASAGRGLAYGDGTFALGYWGRSDLTLSYLRGLDQTGADAFPQGLASNVRAPSFGVDLAWSGSAFGAVWSDARVDDNYEVYFARFDSLGNKLGPDLRLTEAEDFSIHSRVHFDQGRYVIVYDDRREEDFVGPQVYAQLIDDEGEPISGEIRLTDDSEEGEFPAFAATNSRIGVVYTSLVGDAVQLRFRTFDKSFEDPTPVRTLVLSGVRAPRVSALGNSFLVTWDVYDSGPGATIRGMVLDEFGQPLGNVIDLTSGATFARSHSTLSLGDRALFFWADDFDGNYEIYAKVLQLGVAGQLSDVEPRTRLTNDPSDSLAPYGALSESGRVGVLFDDWRAGTHGAYFTSVGCPVLASEP